MNLCDNTGFDTARTEMQVMIDGVLHELQEYLIHNYAYKEYPIEVLREALIAFFEEAGLTVYKRNITELKEITARNGDMHFYIARFVIDDGSYSERPPEGCDCIDDRLVVLGGVRILGLGGCPQYRAGPFQYTDAQMRRRIARLRFALWRSGGVDIVVTHAPPEGLGDLPDPAHRGFAAFVKLIDRYRPTLLLHGHVHLRYAHGMPREREYAGCRIINVSGRHSFEFPDRVAGPGNADRHGKR